jgi:hypothetical protein
MRLVEFQVERFHNIIDSGPVRVDPAITCLVGKNESGKTAALRALYLLNPAQGGKFDEQDDYPRWRTKADQREGTVIDDVDAITATFELDDDEISLVHERLGCEALTEPSVTFARDYADRLTMGIEVDEKLVVNALLAEAGVSAAVKSRLGKQGDIAGLRQAVGDWLTELGESTEQPADQLGRVAERLKARFGDGDVHDTLRLLLTVRLPKFFYFSQYQDLPGRVALSRLTSEATLPNSSGLQTARALLALADTDVERLNADNFEGRMAELEAVANDLTDQMETYWRQSDELEVEIAVDPQVEPVPNPAHGQPKTHIVKYLDVRVRDRRHKFTNNFRQRSSGFRWFFSFLAAFTEFERHNEPTIVLLDEPALTLHGRAQADFLFFIEDRLAAKHQTIYTTHSPFMVQADHLERVRVVEDRGPKDGSVISEDVMTVDNDSAFPLQGALGYDLAQHLFVGPHNLLVEGTSDFTYLTAISDHLRDQGRSHLDERWRVLPAGGSQNIPAFVALLGRKLDVTILIDSNNKGMQRLTALADRGLLTQNRLIALGEVTETNEADIEDVFVEEDYLALYNDAFGSSVDAQTLPPGSRIVKRLAQLNGGGDFDHGKPADYLLRNRDTVLPRLSPATLERFERLFERINSTLDA